MRAHLLRFVCALLLLLPAAEARAQLQDFSCDNCGCPAANFAAGLGFVAQAAIWNSASQPPCDGAPTTATINAGSYRTFFATAGRVYTISLCSTTPENNTVLYITTNAASPLVQVCDDDGCGTTGGLSRVQFTTPGATNNIYRIYPTLGCGVPTTFPVEVTITCEVLTPPNDQVCNATPLPTSSTACNFQLTTNLGATNSGVSEASPLPITTNADCAFGNAQYQTVIGDVWYSAVVPPSGNLGIVTNELDICAGAFSLYRVNAGTCPGVVGMQYIAGTCTQEGLTGPGSDPGAIFEGLTPGETVYIRYWERGGPRFEHGEFEICAFDPERPPNDNPCGAIPLPASTVCNPQTFSNEYASPLSGAVTADPPGCGNTTFFNDVWFTVQWTAQMASDGLTVTTFAGSTADVAMALYHFTPGNNCTAGNLTVLPTLGVPATACNDNITGSNLMASVNTRNPLINPVPPLAVGDLVYVRVWSETPYFGTFSICAVENELPPNDDPCGALPLPLNYGCAHQPATNANATVTPANYLLGTPPSIQNGGGSCVGPYTADVWYTITVPTPVPANGITVDLDGGLMDDAGLLVYRVLSGSCATNNIRLGVIGCSGGVPAVPPYTDLMPTVNVPAASLTAGQTLYVRVWRQTGVDGNFSICASRSDPPPGDCIYTVNLFDSGNDGWQGSEVEICNNGVCNTYTNLNGSTVTLNFGVLEGTNFSVTYSANGAPQQNQNRFNVVQTTFTPNTQVFNSGNGMVNGSVYSVVVSCEPPPSPPTDCLGATPLCDPLAGVVPNTDSGLPDLNGTNRGCLTGENGGTWYSLNVAQDGIMAFTIDYNGGLALSVFGFIIPLVTNNYDFAIWGPYGPYLPIDPLGTDTAGLELMCPPSGPPIRCSNRFADWAGAFFSLAFNPASTGLVYDAALPVSGAQRFVRHLNVTTGQVYLLYVTPTQVNAAPGAYSITWNNLGPGGAPLNPDPLSNYFTGDDLLVCGPLPVELLTFDAKAVRDQVYVSWSTATELNSSFFEVQRSADGHSFAPIGRVTAAGNSQQRIEYGFIDTAPLPGTSYYRLRSVDQDDSFTYSQTVPVEFGKPGGTGLELYPNPANVSIAVGYDLGGEGTVHWRVLDALGRVIDAGSTAGQRGRNRFVVPLERIEPGTYLMELRHPDGSSLGTARFVKQ